MSTADVRAEALREAAAAVLARQDAVDADLAAKGVLPPIMGRIVAKDFARALTTLATAGLTYDLPESVELVRHEVVASLAAHGRVCAAHIAQSASTRDAWEMLAAECEGLGSRRSGTYDRDVLSLACAKMARGHVDSAVKALADHCGMGVEEWEYDTHREMTKAVPS